MGKIRLWYDSYDPATPEENGPHRDFQYFDVDYALASTLPAGTVFQQPVPADGQKSLWDRYYDMSNPSGAIDPGTGRVGFVLHKWLVKYENDADNFGQINQLFGNVLPPQAVEDDNKNCIFPQSFRYDYTIGSQTYPHRWNTFTRLTEQPAEWTNNKRRHYDFVQTDTWPSLPGYTVCKSVITGTDAFSDSTSYRDEKHYMNALFITGNGGKFICQQGYEVRSGVSYPLSISLCSPNRPAAQWGSDPVLYSYWGLDERNGQNVPDQPNASVSDELRLESATAEDLASGLGSVPIIVSYKINGLQMYGVALVKWITKSGRDYIKSLEVYAIPEQFWRGSILDETGGGDWGDQTDTGGGEGVWTFPSTSRGDHIGTLASDIATESRSRLDAFFTGANGFKIHQILPADIPDIYGALYSTSFIQRYQNTLYSPLSAVLSMHMLPAALVDTASATTSSDLTLSGYSITAQVTHTQYPELPTMHAHHVGSVDIDATDTYLDYAPYTNAYLHLPYIGVLTLDINAIAAGTLSVDYITDAITGNVTALITCTDRDGHTQPKYVAQGNAAYSLPMFAVNQDGASVGKIVSSGIGVAMSALSGNAAGVMGGAAGIVSGAFDAAMARSNTQITGAFAGNAGMISDTMVWMEIVRPQWCEPQHYQLIRGIPSQLSGTIAEFNASGDGYAGYLRVLDIDMDGIQAMDDELMQIEQILRAGIFVNYPT